MGIFSIIASNIKNMSKAKKLRKLSKEEILSFNDDDFFDAILCLVEDAVYDINAEDITTEQRNMYTLYNFEAEVNNGGLCQFFVNSSSECAPYVSEALEAVNAVGLKNLYDEFIKKNNIDVNDLSSFKIDDVKDYEKQTERYDFDSFDDKFYENTEIHDQIIKYARDNFCKI